MNWEGSMTITASGLRARGNNTSGNRKWRIRKAEPTRLWAHWHGDDTWRWVLSSTESLMLAIWSQSTIWSTQDPLDAARIRCWSTTSRILQAQYRATQTLESRPSLYLLQRRDAPDFIISLPLPLATNSLNPWRLGNSICHRPQWRKRQRRRRARFPGKQRTTILS